MALTLSDLQIAQNSEMYPIEKIAGNSGIDKDELIPYGRYTAKISGAENIKNSKNGKLILVTAINPTPAGEGKTTVTVGLGQAMGKLNKNAVIALREPSLGPVFGTKGGAAGGGWSQVLPMEEINLHFTGDIHAVTSANNLLCAMIDNHIYQGNSLGINPKRIVFKRVMDMNDRALRNIVIGMGRTTDGIVRQDEFMITAASEVMAVFCLADSLSDLKERLGRIMIAYRYDGTPVYAKDIKAEGAMTALLKQAFQPNLVQTIEHTPCLMHGGPFANIAHGCNSVLATRYALSRFDYTITEAGFGSDLGAEKFIDIKCRKLGLFPSCVVLVATVRALKYNGGCSKEHLDYENMECLKKGISNLYKHIENMRYYNIPLTVALNVFAKDTENELSYVKGECSKLGVKCIYTYAHSKGGQGCIELAEEVVSRCRDSFNNLYAYDLEDGIKEKIEKVAKSIYGADGVVYTKEAEKSIRECEELGYGAFPVCIAKTQYSLSDNPQLLCRPRDFKITVRGIRICSGAGFVVVYCGDILTMPGLSKTPAAENIDVDENGYTTGLF